MTMCNRHAPGRDHGLSTLDSVSFVVVSVPFLAFKLLAPCLPSRRTTQANPLSALRNEQPPKQLIHRQIAGCVIISGDQWPPHAYYPFLSTCFHTSERIKGYGRRY